MAHGRGTCFAGEGCVNGHTARAEAGHVSLTFAAPTLLLLRKYTLYRSLVMYVLAWKATPFQPYDMSVW